MSYLPEPWRLKAAHRDERPATPSRGTIVYDVTYDGQETNAMLLLTTEPVRSARLVTTNGDRLDTTARPSHEALRVWLRQFVEVVTGGNGHD